MMLSNCGVPLTLPQTMKGLILLICKSGTWYPLHDSSNCRAAEIACYSAGHYSAEC